MKLKKNILKSLTMHWKNMKFQFILYTYAAYDNNKQNINFTITTKSMIFYFRKTN